jgi:hypothetical protein
MPGLFFFRLTILDTGLKSGVGWKSPTGDSGMCHRRLMPESPFGLVQPTPVHQGLDETRISLVFLH